MQKLITDPLTDKQYTSVKKIIAAHNVSEYLVYSQRRKNKTLKQALDYAIKHSKPKKVVIDPNTGNRYKSYKDLVEVYGIDYKAATNKKRHNNISYEDQVRGLVFKKEVVEEPVKEEVIHVDDYIKPSYYKEGKYECIDVLNDILSDSGLESFCRGNVIKYLWRCKSKNGLEDLIKAKYYLDKLIDVVKNKKV